MLRIAHLANYALRLLVVMLFVACRPTAEDEYRYVGREVSIAYLKSLCISMAEPITLDLSIAGRVVANDKMGELNRAIAIMDDTAGIELKVECDDIDLIIPLYSEVVVRCSGLWLGREGEKIVLGAKPSSHYVVDRVAESELGNILLEVNLPSSTPQSRRRTVAEIEPGDMSCLVRIEKLRFADAASGAQWCDRDSLTGRYITTLRYAEDDTGVIGVVVDKECDYRMETLPEGEVTLFAVVDRYASERVLRITNHSII